MDSLLYYYYYYLPGYYDNVPEASLASLPYKQWCGERESKFKSFLVNNMFMNIARAIVYTATTLSLSLLVFI